MADITNLTQFLSDIADAIRTKKETSETIPAAEFDTQILSIQTGVETDDADATEDNIEKGKTAYVKGEKITGTLTSAGGSTDVMVSADNITIGNERGWDCVSTKYTNSGKKIYKDGWYANQHIKFEDLAPKLGVTSDKIVSGNTILGIEGTAETMDSEIEETINAQDALIETQQQQIYDLVLKLEGKGAPDDISLNIFTETTEPTSKDGIWIKDTLVYDNVLFDTEIISTESWNHDLINQIPATKYTYLQRAMTAIYNDDIYFISPDSSTALCKYNITNKVWTDVATLPTYLYDGTAVIDDDIIYYTSGSKEDNCIRAYDISTGVQSVPCNHQSYVTRQTVFAKHGRYIYLISGYGNYKSSLTTVKRWNIDTGGNTLETMASFPYAQLRSINGFAVTYNDDIYCFGAYNSTTATLDGVCKYNTTTNSWTKLNNLPEVSATAQGNFGARGILMGTVVYIFFTNGNVYKYDFITDSYTKIDIDVLSVNKHGYPVLYGNSIYIPGSGVSSQGIAVFAAGGKKYTPNNLLVAQNGPNYHTKLVSSLDMECFFDDIYMINENGEMTDLAEKYYGNGTEWIKIEE